MNHSKQDEYAGSVHFAAQEGQLYWCGKALYMNSASLVAGGALRRLPEIWEEACLYLVPSPGLGYGIPEACQRLPPTSRLLLVEWDVELARFSARFLADSGLLAHSNIHFLPLLNSELAAAQLPLGSEPALEGAIARLHHFLEENQQEAWRGWCFRRVRLLVLNRGFAMQRAAFQPIFDWLEYYARNFWQNRLTLDRLGPLWLRNLFRNLTQLPRSQEPAQYRQLLLRSGHIVLAAAGPSLEWHIPWLRRERCYYTLICVDTALLPLLEMGLLPDAVVNLDAQVLNLQDFYGVSGLLREQTSKSTEQTRQLWQIADLSCDPRSFAALPVPFVLTATQFAPMQLWQRLRSLCERLGQLRRQAEQSGAGDDRARQSQVQQTQLFLELEPLGSVGISSLAVVLHGLCGVSELPGNILLVGYDFAYPKDLRHLRGTSIHRKLLEWSRRLNPLNCFAASLGRASPDMDKEQLAPGFVSDRVLYAYARQLQSYVQRRGRGCRIARLPGLLELPSIAALNYRQASAVLRSAAPDPTPGGVSGGASVDPSSLVSLDSLEAQHRLLRNFWRDEWQILQGLERSILNGCALSDAPGWWQEQDFAADYLLRLCLPKAGYQEAEHCNWPKLLQLSRNFSALLEALLATSFEH